MTSEQATASAVRVQGLEKSYRDRIVLCRVDREISAGIIFALLGSNGAGKTAVVKILSMLLLPDAGAAAVHGLDVTSAAHRVRESISPMGQFAAVDEILTGQENLVLMAKLRRQKHTRVVADELLERFALTDVGCRKVSAYSGGLRRRLDIAMSLLGNPAVIFLNEPTTGLDPQARLDVWAAVKKLAHDGTTMLLTTQYLDEAEHLADRVPVRSNLWVEAVTCFLMWRCATTRRGTRRHERHTGYTSDFTSASENSPSGSTSA